MSFIWDVENPNQPAAELNSVSPLVSLAYQPKNVDLIGGGCYNGLIMLYDLRSGGGLPAGPQDELPELALRPRLRSRLAPVEDAVGMRHGLHRCAGLVVGRAESGRADGPLRAHERRQGEPEEH